MPPPADPRRDRHHAGDRHRRRAGQRDERPPVGAPAEGDRQKAAEQRPDQIRHPRARPPDPERAAAPLGREAADGAGQRSRADQSGSRSLDHPRDEQLAEAGDERARDRADGEQRQPAERQRARAETIHELPAGDQQQRVGAEVGAEDGRRGAALDVEPARHGRQRDGDQRAVQLQQSSGRGAGAEGQPGGARDRRLGGVLLSVWRGNRHVGHSDQYRDFAPCAAQPDLLSFTACRPVWIRERAGASPARR